jgi:glycosyltransferase involved in cell wall biosynthesis
MLLVSLARAMDRERIALEVGYRLPHKSALVPALNELGIATHCLAGQRPWPLRLRALLAHGRYDVVHTHAPLVGTAARMVAPRGTALFHTEHNTWSRYHPATRVVNAVTIGRNQQVWAVSDHVAQSIRVPRPLLRPSVEVMLHGVDEQAAQRGPTAREEALRRLRIDDGGFVFGTVGNLAPKKDQGTLIEAFARAKREMPNSWLVIVGTGPREPALRVLARKLGVEHAVRFTGMRDDVPALLPGFDVFVLSSLHEGLSIALVEALAAGVPVVATRVGGIPELITDGAHGILVAPRNTGALERAMTRLAADAAERRRLSFAGVQRAAAFGIAPAAARLSERYLRVAAPHPEVAAVSTT